MSVMVRPLDSEDEAALLSDMKRICQPRMSLRALERELDQMEADDPKLKALGDRIRAITGEKPK